MRQKQLVAVCLAYGRMEILTVEAVNLLMTRLYIAGSGS